MTANSARCIAVLLFVGLAAGFAQAQQPPLTKTKEDVEKTRDAFLDIIRQEQSDHVKVSVDQYNCFTDEDLADFHKKEVTKKIIDKLKADDFFLTIRTAVSAFDAIDRNQIYAAGKRTYKKTWAELKEISPKGQTDAGSRAEREIAEAVVGLLRELVELDRKR